MKTHCNESLFEEEGRLRLNCLDDGARELLESMLERLGQADRRMFLPLDLLVELVHRGHQDMSRMIALATEGTVPEPEVGGRLRVLADEIDERDTEEAPELKRGSFSRGFTRILEEAWEQARARGASALSELDLLRVVQWRVEAVESASIQWSIRRLGEGKGDTLFDERGMLRLELFDETSQGILQGAMKIASSHGTAFLGTPHLVAMMTCVHESIMWRSARTRGLEPGRLRQELLRLIGSRSERIPEFLLGRKTLTPRVIRMLQWAVRQTDETTVSEKPLVESFLEDGGSSLELIQALGLETEIRQALADPRVIAGAEPVEAAIQFAARRQPSPTLDTLGRDLTAAAVEGKLPEIVGREKELRRVFNVLMRREQRNPLLTGEAGVGKTALAVGLARSIALGQAPSKLRGYRVIELDGASLVGGTSYRGDLEARIKNLIEEASEQVILFIDEVHAVFAPRSGSNTPAEVPNHFKSALASGEISVLGATTDEEYHRWFEQDSALKRRFERIEVAEPTREMVVNILSTLVPAFEAEYGVLIDAEAIEHAIDLSIRFMPEQRLPDKAKKVLMDACISSSHGLHLGGQPLLGGSESRVGRQDVSEQVHLKTGVPLDRLRDGELSWWEGLEDRLRDLVFGQQEAMMAIAHALITSRIKNAGRHRPLSVLAFVGPAGTGKASAAALLAREIFDDARALIRLDMADFQEAHALSRLIGSPPGYVGYEDADMLVTPLRRRPSSVVILEDFDRAHPRIQDRLFRLMDDGEISDTRGHRADASNSIFVLTLNVETEKRAPIGFGALRGKDVLKEISDPSLARRLSGRVDEVIQFRGIGGEDGEKLEELIDAMVSRFQANMRNEYRREIVLDPSLRQELSQRAQTIESGKQLEELIDELLVNPTARWLLGAASEKALTLLFVDGEVNTTG